MSDSIALISKTMGLSPNAHRVLDTIHRLTRELGRPPQHKETAHALGYDTVGGISHPLTELARAGLIRRGIMLTSATCPHCGGQRHIDPEATP